MRECSFSIQHFRWILKTAQESGYAIQSLSEWALGRVGEPRSLLLRHDIDVSPGTARRLAEVEVELGVKASYYVRLRARNYNALSVDSYAHLRWIADQGFEVGVHYEPMVYQELALDPAVALAEESRLLQAMMNVKIYGGAAHLAATYGVLPLDVVQEAGLLYEASAPAGDEAHPRWKYLSDSGRRWREGCVCQWLGRVARLVVLIHPVWWFETNEDPTEIVTRLRRGD